MPIFSFASRITMTSELLESAIWRLEHSVHDEFRCGINEATENVPPDDGVLNLPLSTSLVAGCSK